MKDRINIQPVAGLRGLAVPLGLRHSTPQPDPRRSGNTTGSSTFKHIGDFSEARHRAHVLCLDILATGYICLRQGRVLRGLLRHRGQLVCQRTTHILIMQSQCARKLGASVSGNTLDRWMSPYGAATSSATMPAGRNRRGLPVEARVR